MPVPNSFANVTTSIPLSQLDANFNTPITIGNTAVQLGNTVTTLNNMTLANVTISSGSVTITNVSATTANVTTANVTNLISGNVALTGGSINGTTLGASNAATANVTTLTATNLTLSNSAVISVNTAGDALRITQTGAGNALVVEDTTNPDSSPFVVDADGRVVLQSAVTNSLGVAAGQSLVVQSTGGANQATMGMVRNANDIGSPVYSFAKTRGTTAGAVNVVSSGDGLGEIRFLGSDGTAFINAARIESFVDGTPGTNDMPGRLVFSTTADGASSPTERMRIDSAGQVGIGATTSTGVNLRVGRNITGALVSYAVNANGVIQSDVTSQARMYSSIAQTAAASFTLNNLYQYIATQGTFGAGSAVTNQYGYFAESTLTGATNNYGFYSDIASGTGRWNFYANGTADNFFAGSVGIGTTTLTGYSLRVGANITGGVNAFGIQSNGAIQSDVTTGAFMFRTAPTTAAASFTLTSLVHYAAAQGALGGSSAITNQYGFFAGSTLTGATNNYGFYSDIASGTGRFNFYANGTAENYLGGNLKIGGTAARATTAGTNQLVLFNGTAPVGTLANGVSFYSASGEARVMDAAGNSTLLSPHDSVSNEWIFHSKHTPTGKVLRIDVEKMLRFINDHFGLDMVHEFTEGE